MIVDKYGRVAGSIDLAALTGLYAGTDDPDLRAHYAEVAAEFGVDLDVGAVATTADQPDESDGAPPRSGAGSGRDAWVAYAESRGVEVTDDMTRDEIIDAVDKEN